MTTPKSRWFRILCLLEVHGIPVGLQVGLGMRVPVVWCIRLAEPAPGRAGGPGLTAGPNEVRTERPGVSGVRHCLLRAVVDGRCIGWGPRCAKGPGPWAREGARGRRVRGGPREQGLWGPGDSLRCCRVDSADGLSSNYCKRLGMCSQAHREPSPLPVAPDTFALIERRPF